MSSIINKLLGKDEHTSEHSHKTDVKCEDGSCKTTVSGGEKITSKQECKSGAAHGGSCESRSVQHDGVNIKSTISTDGKSSVSLVNQQKLTDLVTKLGTTHTQIDTYAKEQSDKIDAQIQGEIDSIVARTRREQEGLLQKANERTAEIDNEYRARLQVMVEELDGNKAKRISEIEVELNNQQAAILQAARNDIDVLNKKAAKLKIGVLEAAEAKVASNAREIIDTAHLDKAATIHQATGTTTIKTEVSGVAATATASGSAAAATTGAASTARSATSGAQHVSETKTVETNKSQSESRK